MSFNTLDRNMRAQALWARGHCWRWRRQA